MDKGTESFEPPFFCTFILCERNTIFCVLGSKHRKPIYTVIDLLMPVEETKNFLIVSSFLCGGMNGLFIIAYAIHSANIPAFTIYWVFMATRSINYKRLTLFCANSITSGNVLPQYGAQSTTRGRCIPAA